MDRKQREGWRGVGEYGGRGRERKRRDSAGHEGRLGVGGIRGEEEIGNGGVGDWRCEWRVEEDWRRTKGRIRLEADEG